MAASTNGYTEKSHTLLIQAQQELALGDLTQASEKLWGAAAQAVKAVAQRRGWRHSSHRLLWQALNRVAGEVNDPSLRTLFQVADSLHSNFYETIYPEEVIEASVVSIEEFISKLERL